MRISFKIFYHFLFFPSFSKYEVTRFPESIIFTEIIIRWFRLGLKINFKFKKYI